MLIPWVRTATNTLCCLSSRPLLSFRSRRIRGRGGEASLREPNLNRLTSSTFFSWRQWPQAVTKLHRGHRKAEEVRKKTVMFTWLMSEQKTDGRPPAFTSYAGVVSLHAHSSAPFGQALSPVEHAPYQELVHCGKATPAKASLAGVASLRRNGARLEARSMG